MEQPETDEIVSPLYYTSSELAETRLYARLSEMDDLAARIDETERLSSAALSLRLPVETRAYALYFLHRLRASKGPLRDTSPPLARLVCLSLAMKLKESVRRLKDIHSACFGGFASGGGHSTPKDSDGELSPWKDLVELKDALLPVEFLLQMDIRFEEDIETPFRTLIRMIKEKRCMCFMYVSSESAEMANTFVCNSRSTCCRAKGLEDTP